MGQDDIYRVLLELKETTGRIEAGQEDIKTAVVEQSVKHDILQKAHNDLDKSHSNLKLKVVLVSSAIGTFLGSIGTYFGYKIKNGI